jgi:flagellar motor switch/type III secretory pathway protein FliN
VAPRRLVAWAAGLGAVEFPATADLDDGSLAGELELEVLRGFWGVLVPQAVAVDAPLECLNDADAEGARLALAKRGLSTACVFGPAPACRIQWTLSPTIVAMLLAERRVSYVGESLTSRRSALAQAPVALDCCLGSMQVPVRDLHSLRLGDVLMTDIALDGHAELRVRSKPRPIAAGTIGQLEGRKAIKVETAKVVTARGLHR